MFDNFDKTMNKYGSNSDWLILKEGANKVRLMSNFADYGDHFIKEENKSYICIGKENGCVYCEKGLKPKVQFLGWAIDRSDGQLKLFRFGYTIAKQLASYKDSEEYGFEDLPPYDIVVNKEGQGLETNYVVMPARTNTEITMEEKDNFEKNSKSPEEIIQSMKDKINPLDGIEPAEETGVEESLPTLEESE